ncbi:MAG TPA: DUF4173 domain-containing protein [Thermoanaerobaculia bacterium]|nr:DUF4173 domain-containing protein [Thermoanaerobaculia bacterium]
MHGDRTARSLLLAALLLGALADALLRYVPPGLNVLLWTAVCVTIALRAPRRSWFAGICALVAASGLVWRSAETLTMLDILLLAVFLPMLAIDARGVRVAAAGLMEIAGGVAWTGVQTAAGLPQLLFRDLAWRFAPREDAGRVKSAARGIVIAVVPLIVFGTLLSSADEHFAKLFSIDISDAVTHVIVTLVVAAICAGFLRSLYFSDAMPRISRPSFVQLPEAEINIALALVNVLFALFVMVQFRYFFGAAPAALAEYARRGFFELVAVVALVLPMLLAMEWLVSRRSATFRALALTQVALVFVIAASAYRRMQLYRDEFGLTQLRFYTTAFMVWLAVLLLWFAIIVLLRGQRQRFAIGVLSTAVAAVVLLHAINPDALIVNVNLQRAADGRRAFDSKYAGQLSDDAAEVIVAHRTAFDPIVFYRYVRRERPMGWRTWNVSRARAIAAVAPYRNAPQPLRIERHAADRPAVP